MLRSLSSRANTRVASHRPARRVTSLLVKNRSILTTATTTTTTSSSSSSSAHQNHCHPSIHNTLLGPQHFQFANDGRIFGLHHDHQIAATITATATATTTTTTTRRCYSTVLASSCSGSHFPTSSSSSNGDDDTTSNTFQVPAHHSNHRRQQIRNKVFVSRHNQSLNVTSDAIVQYCNSHNIDTSGHRTTMTHVILKECPFCSKPTGGKASNQYKLYIQIGGGAYFCHRCGASGSCYDLKSTVGGYSIDTMMGAGAAGTAANTAAAGPVGASGEYLPHQSSRNGVYSSPTMAQAPPPTSLQFKTGNGGGVGGERGGGRPANNSPAAAAAAVQPLPMPKARLSGYYSSRLLDPQNEQNEVLKYLQDERGLNRKTLRQYGVGRANYQFPSDQGGYQSAECVTFPWIMRTSEVQEQEALRGVTLPLQGETAQAKDAKTKNETNNNNNNNTKKAKDAAKEAADENETSESETTTTTTAADKLLTRRIKVRAVDNKSWQRLDPAGGGWGLFGWHTVPPGSNEIVVTEGEYDAMAVHQATGQHAVSLPNGCRSLPLQVLPLLEQFDKIYLWMDSDLPGQEGAEQFAKKLGINRCYLVKTSLAKDANEALLKGLDLNAMLQDAKLVPHERILTFADLRQDVLHELLQPELYMGSPVPSLPGFTKLIKGFRRGEVTVLTGPTGSGKTTFLGQVSLDLAEQGCNVLWGSFEIKNTRLLHKLLKQFARNPLPDHKDANASELLGALADRFQNLPLYFMKFHGGSEVDEVLDAMEYAVYVNDVEHIILDNMQFMITRQTNNSKFDKFDIQDMAIEKFRKFATEHNVHLSLVVHPRKEDEASKLSISSFFGSAKATQEADTVLILQNDGRRKYIDVKKNRFDGTLGYSPLYFEAKSGRYVETEGGYNSGGPGQQQQQQQQQHQQQQPQKIEFAPPRKAWNMKQEPEEPEPPNLANHWTESLGLPP